MKEKKSDLTKINAAMRSLYRFSELEKMDSPDIILDNERNILRRYLSELTAEEILYIVDNFKNYHKEQMTNTALEDERLAKKFTRYLAELN